LQQFAAGDAGSMAMTEFKPVHGIS